MPNLITYYSFHTLYSSSSSFVFQNIFFCFSHVVIKCTHCYILVKKKKQISRISSLYKRIVLPNQYLVVGRNIVETLRVIEKSSSRQKADENTILWLETHSCEEFHTHTHTLTHDTKQCKCSSFHFI